MEAIEALVADALEHSIQHSMECSTPKQDAQGEKSLEAIEASAAGALEHFIQHSIQHSLQHSTDASGVDALAVMPHDLLARGMDFDSAHTVSAQSI